MADRNTSKQHTGELVPFDEKWLPLGIVDDDDMGDAFADRILNAASWEEALTIPETRGLRDFSGQVITVIRASGRRSTLKDSSGIYAVMDIAYGADGETEQVTCGAKNVLAVLTRAASEKRYPFQAKVVEVQSKSDPSRFVLYLTTVSEYDQPFSD